MRLDDRQLAAAAAPAAEEAPGTPDPIIDAVMAHAVQADAVRVHPLAAWVPTVTDSVAAAVLLD